jgi:hypothetical protein
MTDTTPLPTVMDVRELLEGLLGRDVETELTSAGADPRKHPGAMVGVYVDDAARLRAIVVVDMALSAALGAAIGLMGARLAGDVVRSELLSPALYDNAAEILNVAASLFNAEGAPHVRLQEAYAPREITPSDVDARLRGMARRVDIEMTVSGYGAGRMSVVVP